MPRQENRDPNVQRPSRREKDYGIYKLVNELSQQSVVAPTQETTKIEKSQVGGGQVVFGRSNVTRTGGNTYTDLANLLQAGMQAGSASVQGLVTVGKIDDKRNLQDLQTNIGNLSPLLNPEERALEEKKLYEQYEEKMNLVDNQARLKAKVNEYKKQLPVLTDQQASLRLEEKLLEIDQRKGISEVDKETLKLAEYQKTLNSGFNTPAIELAARKAQWNSQKKANKLEFADIAAQFKIDKNNTMASDYLTDEDKEFTFKYYIEQYAEVFADAFGDNPDLMREAEVLLSGQSVEASNFGDSVEAAAERSEDRFMSEVDKAAKDVLARLDAIAKGGDLVNQYYSTNPKIYPNTDEGRLAQAIDFIDYAKGIDPSIDIGVDTGNAERDAAIVDNLNKRLADRGATHRGNLVRRNTTAIGKEITDRVRRNTKEASTIFTDPKGDPDVASTSTISALSDLGDLRAHNAVTALPEAIDTIHSLAQAAAVSVVDSSQENAFVQQVDFLADSLGEVGYTPEEVDKIKKDAKARKFDPTYGIQTLDPATRNAIQGVYNEDKGIVNLRDLRYRLNQISEMPWGQRQLHSGELILELTGMLDRSSALLMGSAKDKIKTVTGDPNKTDGILAVIKTGLDDIWMSSDTELGQLAVNLQDSLVANEDLIALVPDEVDRGKLAAQIAMILFTSDFITSATDLRHMLREDIESSGNVTLPVLKLMETADTLEAAYKDGNNPFTIAMDTTGNVQELGIEPTPNEVAISATDTDEKWETYLNNALGDMIPTFTAADPMGSAERVGDAITDIIRDPAHPIMVSLAELKGKDQRDKTIKFLQVVTNGKFTGSTAGRFADKYILPLLDEGVITQDTPAELQQRVREAYVQKIGSFEAEITGFLTADYFQRDYLDKTFKVADPEVNLTETEELFQERFEVAIKGRRNAGQEVRGAPGYEKTEAFINELYNFLGFDVASSFLDYSITQSGNVTVKDLTNYLASNNLKLVDVQPFTAVGGMEKYKGLRRFEVQPMYELDDPQHPSNRHVVSIGRDVSNGVSVQGIVNKEGQDRFISELKEVGGNDPQARQRIDQVQRILEFDYALFDDEMFTAFLQGKDELETALPEDMKDLAPVFKAFFTADGLTYNGLVAMEQWALSNMELREGMTEFSAEVSLRNGRQYFTLRDSRLEAATPVRPTEVFYMGQAPVPFKTRPKETQNYSLILDIYDIFFPDDSPIDPETGRTLESLRKEKEFIEGSTRVFDVIGRGLSRIADS